VNFQGTTVALNSVYNNLPGGTTALQRGQASFPNGCVVQGGTLQFDGGSAEGNVYQVGMVASRLCGTGAISGYVYQDYGTVAPGHSPGALAIGDRYEQGSNAVLEIELGGKTPGTGYDQLQVGGNASLKGTLNVELYDGYVPAAGQRFDVVRSASVSNAFKATNLPALGPGLSWLVLYRADGVQLRVASATDADGDGLQDDWETAQFGNLATSDGGGDDFDDDGYATTSSNASAPSPRTTRTSSGPAGSRYPAATASSECAPATWPGMPSRPVGPVRSRRRVDHRGRIRRHRRRSRPHQRRFRRLAVLSPESHGALTSASDEKGRPHGGRPQRAPESAYFALLTTAVSMPLSSRSSAPWRPIRRP
jgi:hypothetical protein